MQTANLEKQKEVCEISESISIKYDTQYNYSNTDLELCKYITQRSKVKTKILLFEAVIYWLYGLNWLCYRYQLKEFTFKPNIVQDNQFLTNR